MNQSYLLALMVLMFPMSLSAQPTSSSWTLEQAINYAQQHNISIKQSEVNSRLAKLQLLQSQLTQLPQINASAAYGNSFGRSVDPNTNQFVYSTYDFLSLSGSANVLVFGWFQTRNTIKANQYALSAAKADLEQLQNDVSLNVATGYLRAILAREQVHISQKQVSLSKAQLQQTQKFVDAGRLPELSAKQLIAQLASDSATLIGTIMQYNSAIIDIKALLNLDFETPFDILEPDIEIDPFLRVDDINAAYIYEVASGNYAAVKSSEWQLKAAIKRKKAARGALYPQLSINGQSGTNYAATFKEIKSFSIAGAQPTGAFAYDSISKTAIPVYQPILHYESQRIPLNKQLDNNLRQSISLALNFPIFNGWQAQSQLRQAKINQLASDYSRQATSLKLKQEVYKAYNDAHLAIQKYQAAKRATVAAQEAYAFAKKRFELGLTNTVEYLTIQNNQFVAEANLQSAKYDLIFKLKIIDYYLGKPITLNP